MRITKITVKNFRSIKHAELEPSQFNVFAGQNNHGKTNFFEAIEWFYNGSGAIEQLCYGHDVANEVSVEIEYDGIQEGIEAVKNAATKDKFRKFADGKDILVVARRSAETSKRSLWTGEEWSVKNFAGFDKAFNDCLPRLQYVSTRTRLEEISKWGKKTPIGEMLSGVLTAILEGSQRYRDFKDKFHELFTDDESEVRLELNGLAVKVRLHLERQFPECTKIEFGVTPPAFEDLLKSFDTSVDDGIETLAQEKGDGMQRALMLAIIKTYSDYRREKDELGKRFLFLIDEAELHLHPTAQRQLKEALLELAGNGDQVFINTHSSVLVADHSDGQSLWKVMKRKGATEITPIADADKPDLVFELLGGSPGDLLFPRNFLIVEGTSEDLLISGVVKRFYANEPWIKVIRANGDDGRQQRTMDAINTAFTPLVQTPIYSERLVVLCDKPHQQREEDFKRFCSAYKALNDKGHIVVSLQCSLEECYPAQWQKSAEEVAQMKSSEKTALAAEVGQTIEKDQFEREMPHIFNALTKVWASAHK